MATYKTKDVSYNTLHNDHPSSLPNVPEDSEDDANDLSSMNENEHDDVTGVIIHKVPENNRGGWTHIEDLDSFFTRMYKYYLKGGFCAMAVSDICELLQYFFVIYFVTFLVYCVDYPVLLRKGETPLVNNVTLSDIVYPNCKQRVTTKWWLLIGICSIVGFIRLIRSIYYLFHAYDTKLFYNNGLKISDSDLGWLSWHSIQTRVRDAQKELQMCIHKQQITELDIYHRILRFHNYMVAMVNKRLLPLYISIPCFGDMPYLSKGLKYNLELLLFYNPWSPWENCWHLRDSYKDASKRLVLAKELENHISLLALLNLILAPLIFSWQILHFFFNYAELIKRSPESLGLRTWSVYSRILLRHFNELDHELSERLSRAHKPATKYLASFPSPVITILAKNIAFLSGSILGVLIILSLIDEIVLTVENMLFLMTALGCTLAIARSFIPEEGIRQRSSEELLIQVLGHVHYLPASWRGKAHTKHVAAHFQQLFQFRATYILIELLSPLVCPFILYSFRSRALDIVDFYRNFTVNVLDIGDVCSFAQMDVRRHGNPDWPAGKETGQTRDNISQYNQAEDGKTELSLVAFSCRNPGWRVPHPSQRQYLQTLHNSVFNTTNNTGNPFAYQNNLSLNQRNNIHGFGPTSNVFHSGLNIGATSSDAHRIHMETDENRQDEQNMFSITHENKNLFAPDRPENLTQEEQDLSLSTLHLYDIHLAKISQRSTRQNISYIDDTHASNTSFYRPTQRLTHSNEDTPLLRKTRP